MNKGYIFSADVIRSIAIIGAVSIHIVNAIYTRADFFGGTTWWLSILIDSFSRVSIPLFILLSGYLILGKDESFQESLKRIWNRIAIPLFFWFSFYIWYGGGIPNLKHFDFRALENIFYGNMFHLYFLVIIVGLYFVAPFIRSFLKNYAYESETIMKWFLVLGSGMVALQFVFQSCGTENFFTKFLPYTGLFLAGHVLGNKKNYDTKLLVGFYVIGFAATFAGNYVHYFFAVQGQNLFASKGCLSHYSDHYLSPNVLMMSISLFLLVLNFDFKTVSKNIITRKIIQTISITSFGIYILHPFVARFLEMQFRLAIDFSPLPIMAIILLRLFLVLVISFVLTMVGIKIPVVKKVFGAK